MKTNEIEVIVKSGNETYRANRYADNKVTIDRWNPDGGFWEWVGDGKWDSGVVDCAADIADDAYSAIDDAVEAAE